MTAPSAPTREIGYAAEAGSTSYNWWMYDGETTPELRWPLSVQVYDQMRTQDAQIQSVLRAVTMPVRRTPWRVDPNGARDEVVRFVADDLGLPVVGESKPQLPLRAKDRFSWAEHLRLALLMLPFGHCVDQETEALTQRGWLRRDDLRVGDQLLTLNSETGLSEWQPCEDVHRYEGTHVVRRLEGRSHSSVTTLNHRWITRDHNSGKLRFRTSENLTTGDRFLRAAPSAGLPTEPKWSDAFVELVAWYWTEGHEHAGGGAAIWQSEDVNGPYCQRIRAALTLLFGPGRRSLLHGQGAPLGGWREATRVKRGVTYWYLDKVAAEELRSVAPRRVVQPDFIASLTSAQLRLFVDTSIDADGCHGGGSSRRGECLVQKDGARLDAFEMACSLLGVPWTRRPFRTWSVTTLGTQTEIRPVYAARRSDGQMTDTLGVVHDGVWCPQVKNRTWLARRRGTVYFTGNSFFEQVYRVDGDGSRAHLRKLGPRLPRTIEEIKVARDGGLVSITQYGTVSTDGPQRPIPVNRLVAYVHEREGGNWLGRSILRSSYKNWLLKDRLLRVQAQTIERNGMGIPTYTAAEGETDLANGKALATSLRAGETAGAAIPFGAVLELKGVTGDLPDADPAIRYHDEQIARGVLAHFLNLGTQTGSWALGTTFADFFTLSLQTLADQVGDTATQHIVEDLVDVNWGEDEPAPRIVHDEIGSRQQATAQAIKLLVDAGIIKPDDVLEESTRQQYGLPPSDPDTARDQDAGGFGGFGASPPPAESGGSAEYGAGSAVYASGDIDADDDDEPGQFDDDVLVAAAAAAIAEFTGVVQAKALWNPALHPRNPKTGEFRTVFGRVMHALELWSQGRGGDRPLKGQGFTRDNLRDVATKHLGLSVRRGAPADEIEDQLLDYVRDAVKGRQGGPSAKFTLRHGRLRDVDVAVYRTPDGKPVLYREDDSGRRGSLVQRFDTLDDMARWADDNDEPRVAEWARKESGRKAPAKAVAKKAPAKAAATTRKTAAHLRVGDVIHLRYPNRDPLQNPTARITSITRERDGNRVFLGLEGRESPPRVTNNTLYHVVNPDAPSASSSTAATKKTRAPTGNDGLSLDSAARAVQQGGEPMHAVLFGDPSPRPMPARKSTPAAKKAAPKASADFDPDDYAERIARIPMLRGQTAGERHRREIDAELVGLDAGQLRRVATALNLQIPAKRREGGTWTRENLRSYIAESVVRDRTRWTLGGETPTQEQSDIRERRRLGIAAGLTPNHADAYARSGLTVDEYKAAGLSVTQAIEFKNSGQSWADWRGAKTAPSAADLTPAGRDALTFLDARGGSAPHGSVPSSSLSGLVASGYVRVDDDGIHLTDAGRKALGGAAVGPASDVVPGGPGPGYGPELSGLTVRQRRARLKALGFTSEQIDEIAPTAAAAKKAAPKAARPDYLDAENSLLLERYADSIGLDLRRFVDPTRAQMVTHGEPLERQYPFSFVFADIVDGLRSGKVNQAAAIAELRAWAPRFRREAEGAQRLIDRVKPAKATNYEFAIVRDGEAAADTAERLADALEGLKLPRRKRLPTLGEVTAGNPGELAAIDEALFDPPGGGGWSRGGGDSPKGGLVQHRGEIVPESFEHPRSGMALFMSEGGRPIRPGLTQAENDALDQYVLAAVADPLNGALRAGRIADLGVVNLSRVGEGIIHLDDVLTHLDSAIAGSTLSRNAALYRGALLRPLDLRQLKPGAILTEPGYMSTAADKHLARSIIAWRRKNAPAHRQPVVFKMLADKGTHAAVGHERAGEILLGRGRRLQVVSVGEPDFEGVREVVVRLLPD